MTQPTQAPSPRPETSSRADRFLRACRREAVDRTPVWFMRQAGRYLPEYRELRGDKDLLDTCRTPELAAEVTLQPLRRFPADAAILFSDIMVPLHAIGVPVRIVAGTGPVVDPPIRSAADLDVLRPMDAETDVAHVLEAVRILRRELDVPLIGFTGAPFTLASYLIEGGPSRDYRRTKAMMHGDPAAWDALMGRLSAIMSAYVVAQVTAGAQAIQVFDSWAGALDPEDYRRFVFPHTKPIFDALAPLDVPTIWFGVGTGELLGFARELGAGVGGVDWRVPIDDGRRRLGPDMAVQGNLDPAVLFAPWDAVERKAAAVLDRIGGAPGHVFNLGHGVMPQTDPDMLVRLVDFVHERTAREGA